jgi:hypothetical protein
VPLTAGSNATQHAFLQLTELNTTRPESVVGKQASTVPERKQTFATPRRVINLIEALRRSIAEDKKLSAAARKEPPRPRRANGRECHAAQPCCSVPCARPGLRPSQKEAK